MATAANLPPAVAEEAAVGAAKTARTQVQRNNRQGRTKVSAPLTGLMWLIVAIYAFPLLWFILSSFKPGSELFSYPLSMIPREWTFQGFMDAWERVDFAQYFLNTATVAIITTVLTVFFSACTGYALAKYNNKGTRLFFVCILATTMLPTEVILNPTFTVIRDLGLYNSLAGIIVPSVLTATGVFMFRQFFLTVPDDLLHSARIDGASELAIFFRIMLPISKPILFTLAIFSFQWRWNDYIWPLIVLNDPKWYTLQVALRSIVGAENIDWPVLLGASVISILPLVLVFFVFQKYVLNADVSAGLKD
ncbi:carbohydrate ABC transporter permease [Arthrobacter sp. ISL-30]|uniref:carbohydrate ABC transporter permease n=1 Tax=Arthrobacter sp. ISL-30 TaxID=2819109 RepID=UPI001BE8AA80|nr:carbohydrate ABC transporter permease [Arthrobacter sp. ISL-30]MBT2515724.1 carbohydrate ABC transporter permease [Arthrobacter sp. ISL-30]